MCKPILGQDNILKNQLDKLIVNFKTTNPDFVSSYKNARTIIDPAKSSTQLKGIVTNAQTGQPIPSATISLIGVTSNETQTTKTGKFIIKPISIGEYKVVITAPGYTNYTNENVIVKLGQTTTIEAALKLE